MLGAESVASQDAADPASADVLLAQVLTLADQIETAVGGLSVFMHAHILTGSHGPIVDAVVSYYSLEHLHGALRPRSFDEVKDLVMQVSAARRKG